MIYELFLHFSHFCGVIHKYRTSKKNGITVNKNKKENKNNDDDLQHFCVYFYLLQVKTMFHFFFQVLFVAFILLFQHNIVLCLDIIFFFT